MNVAWPVILSLVMIGAACVLVVPVARRVDAADIGILLFAGVLIGVSIARIEVVIRRRRLHHRGTTS